MGCHDYEINWKIKTRRYRIHFKIYYFSKAELFGIMMYKGHYKNVVRPCCVQMTGSQFGMWVGMLDSGMFRLGKYMLLAFESIVQRKVGRAVSSAYGTMSHKCADL